MHKSEGDKSGTNAHSGSKRSAQHAEYHTAETKRRRESAERAARVQKHAAKLVQQLSAPDGHSLPQDTSGTMAKAEERQNAYNLSMDSKPWASGLGSLRHNTDPTTGLPVQTGHYSDPDAPGHQHGVPDAPSDDSPVEQTNSDPAIRAAALQSDSSEGDKVGDKDSKSGSPSPPAPEPAKFSSTQKFKRNMQSNPGMAAIKDRQMDEQTHQNHPQSVADSGKRCVVCFTSGHWQSAIGTFAAHLFIHCYALLYKHKTFLQHCVNSHGHLQCGVLLACWCEIQQNILAAMHAAT